MREKDMRINGRENGERERKRGQRLLSRREARTVSDLYSLKLSYGKGCQARGVFAPTGENRCQKRGRKDARECEPGRRRALHSLFTF